MRCLTLAQALRGRGADVDFVCRNHKGNLIQPLREAGFEVCVLSAPPSSGVTEEQDALETIHAINGKHPDWLIVDHYDLGAAWEERIRPHAGRLMVLDDLATRRHDCDVFLDQNETLLTLEQYRSRLPAACQLILGPRHALLRSEYRRNRKSAGERDATPRRVLVFFGGSDPDNMTGRALEALSGAEFAALHADIVVGANNPHRVALENAARARAATRLLGPRPHLADLMAEADLAIGAGGTTTWERMCVGLPSLVVSIAENQRPGCELLASRRLIRYLGSSETVGSSEIAAGLRECLESPGRLAEMAAAAQVAVDGLGAERVCECLVATPAEALQLRRAEADDVYTYLSWANDPAVRRQSLNATTIDASQHRDWFSAKLRSRDSHLFVLLAGNLPVGQIRFDREGTQFRIDYSIDALFRGRGWGTRLVGLGLQAMRAQMPCRFLAEVKRSNPASAAVFRRRGFVESERDADPLVFLFDASPEMRDDTRCA
jgi:UDP-2,4-diacetamido-2,4,6-trideoxy-beta-L-altropyranose hydrolase